jgi:PIN domain nuclease of toxin-antitoxin system
MGRYLLDSHIFLWFKRNPSKLGKTALTEIESTQNTLFVSGVGLWELADKASKGKLPEFAAIMDRGSGALESSLRESSFRLLPLELSHMARAYRLAHHHRDPFDRIMIAQALVEDLIFISRDTAFRRYAGLKLLAA